MKKMCNFALHRLYDTDNNINKRPENSMRHNNIFNIFLPLCLILLALAAPAMAYGTDNTDNIDYWLKKLDKSLEMADKYAAAHEREIAETKRMVTGRESADARFEAYHRIYLAYQSYRADSAIVYANKCMDLARQMGRNDYMALAKCNLAVICIASGDNIQSYRLLSSIDPKPLPQWVKVEYYKALHKQWVEQKNYFVGYTPSHNEYVKLAKQCADTLLTLVKPHSSDWYMYSLALAAMSDDNERVLWLTEEAIKADGNDKHKLASYYMERAWAFRKKSDEKHAIINFIRSAICDNESATREITSLYQVSSAIQKYDDTRANNYVHKALDFINFYNARIRLIAISNIMPVVERNHLEAVKQQRNLSIIVAACGLLTVCVLGGAYVYARRLNRRLKEAQRTNMEHLEALNTANARLTEANKVKNEYIGRTLYDASEYIDTLDHIFSKINKAVVTRHYSDIADITDKSLLDKERKSMFRNFDVTFLALFPNFVEQYNTLFGEAERKYPAEEGTLTSEMRIFALIRMGVRESERIARYLGYSVHNVNTYKTRAKNRSRVNNDEFEARIMEF